MTVTSTINPQTTHTHTRAHTQLTDIFLPSLDGFLVCFLKYMLHDLEIDIFLDLDVDLDVLFR